MQRLGGLVHRRHDALVGLWARDGQDVGIVAPDGVGFGTHAARDDDLAVLRHGVADGRQRLGLGAVEKPTGVDHHGVGAVVLLRDLVAFGAQPRDDALAVDQRLGAAQRHEGDARRRGGGGRAGAGSGDRSIAVPCHGGAATATAPRQAWVAAGRMRLRRMRSARTGDLSRASPATPARRGPATAALAGPCRAGRWGRTASTHNGRRNRIEWSSPCGQGRGAAPAGSRPRR